MANANEALEARAEYADEQISSLRAMVEKLKRVSDIAFVA